MRRQRPSLITVLTVASVASVASVVGRVAVAAPRTPAGIAASPGMPARSASGDSVGDKPTAPALSPEAAFARATAFYESGQYAECADAFALLLDDESLAGGLAFRSREQARVYRATCLIAQGKTAAADDQFRAAIRESPQMAVPNAIMFPQAVVERFIVVRSGLLEEISRAEAERAQRERTAAAEARQGAIRERERVLRLERLVAQESVVARNRRWVASVPFGIGQFQNRDYVLGSVFLGSEALLLGTAITSVSIELSLVSQASSGARLTQKSQAQQLTEDIKTARNVSLLATGGLVLAVAGGILEANLSFVPEFSDGTRPRRKAPSVMPTVGPTSGGAEFGLMGCF